MVSRTLSADDLDNGAAPTYRSEESDVSLLREFLESLASLSVTIWLFAMSIFLVVAGTLAQVNKEIWQVVDEYFRTFFAWIDLQLFFPPSFFPDRPQVDGGFYFPGGWTLGILLGINLIAAHSVRFRAQARGRRLAGGLALIALGILLTWLVIAGGTNSDGLQDTPVLSWSALWQLALGVAAVCSAGLIVAGYRTPAENRSARRLLIGIGAITAVGVIWLLIIGESGRLSDSSLRILWQLSKGTIAGGVLLAGCVLVFRRRGGIVLLHGGIGLLMFSELLVGLTAVESRMSITEGQTVNYSENHREIELAIIDRSRPDHDVVVSVPLSRLTSGRIIRDDNLPFDIQVEAWFRNAELRQLAPNAPNPATAGLGLEWMAHEMPQMSGTDMSGRANEAAAYITFLNKQNAERLGTHLLSLEQSAMELPEKVTVDEVPYRVYLRFQRIYKPYTISLLDVRKSDYLGTETPRDYSSEIHLVDASRGTDREVRIWMNNPLRYAGETFYQSSYFRDPQSGVETTTLQVVTNTGWMIPYVACMLVATGMLAHFGVVLLRFLNRQESGTATTNDSGDAAVLSAATAREGSSRVSWKSPTVLVPALVVLVLGGWVLKQARVPGVAPDEPDLYAFGRIPIVFQGRAKPIDTLARNALRILSDRQTLMHGDEDPQPAVRWLLDVMNHPEVAANHAVFRIENPDVLQTLGLQPRNGFRYSYAELETHMDDLLRQASLARSLDVSQLTLYQKKLLQVENKLGLYDLLTQSLRRPSVRVGSENEAIDLRVALQRQQMLARRTPPLVIPPDTADQEWRTYSGAALELIQRGTEHSVEAGSLVALFDSIRQADTIGDGKAFNAAVQAYSAAVADRAPAQMNPTRIRFEAFFNHFEPFYHCSVLYVMAFVLTAVSWLGFTRLLNRSAFWLICLTFVIHSAALVGRIYISGRPPVTNLYSSAVFIGWGAVLMGIIFERLNRVGTGNVLSAVVGFATLLIAHFL
ncbi:MAG: cytochrome c biogenesis protein ResB, partial [Planctomycetaceae bacterium]|nr:cytochrome c biogenesis protein ResB [Planctomycetaceae bacterium]